MKLRVCSASGDSGRKLVRFHCELGNAVAVWCSSVAPRTGAEYDAELDTEVVLGPDNAELVVEEEFSVSADDGCSYLTGKLEAVDDDDMAYLRLGDSLLVMIEMTPKTYAPGICLKVRVPWSQLTITPFGGT